MSLFSNKKGITVQMVILIIIIALCVILSVTALKGVISSALTGG
jgi:hypothetical protein